MAAQHWFALVVIIEYWTHHPSWENVYSEGGGLSHIGNPNLLQKSSNVKVETTVHSRTLLEEQCFRMDCNQLPL